MIQYLNIQSLNNKIDEVRDYVNKQNIAILALAETHLTNDIDDWEVDISGYILVRLDSNCRHTGGVALYIKKDLDFKIIHSEEIKKNWWTLGVKILSGFLSGVILSLSYVSPKMRKKEVICKLRTLIELLQANKNDKMVLVGDFNIDVSKKVVYAKLLLDMLDELNMTQAVHDFTRIAVKKDLKNNTLVTSRTLIDYAICNSLDINRYTINVLDEILSDHKIIGIKVNQIIKNEGGITTNRKITVTKWNFKIIQNNKQIRDSFLSELLKCNWDTKDNSSNDMETDILLDKLTRNISSTLLLTDLKITYVVDKRYENNGWFDKELRLTQKDRNIAHKIAVSTNDSNDWLNYRACRNKFVALCRLKKLNHLTNRINNKKKCPIEMWKILKSLYKDTRQCEFNELYFNNKKVVGEKSIADHFNKYFIQSVNDIVNNIDNTGDIEEFMLNVTMNVNDSVLENFALVTHSRIEKLLAKLKNNTPWEDGITKYILELAMSLPMVKTLITTLINNSLTFGKFPEKLKKSFITPIPKLSKAIDGENFRPINTLHIIDKLLESIVKEQLVAFIENNEILIREQSGFRPKHGCESAVMLILDKLKTNIVNKLYTKAIFIDLKRAFDTIDRNILVRKLYCYGVRGIALTWICSYLDNRLQSVKINKVETSFSVNQMGVPQGSILGPLLFIIYINDIASIFKYSEIFLYADDALLVCSGTDPMSVHNNLKYDLIRLEQWLSANRLKLNVPKTKAMTFCNNKLRKQYLDFVNFKFVIDNEEVENVQDFRYLGIILDEELNFNKHGHFIITKLAKKVGIFQRKCNNLPITSKIQICQAIITPHFDYCSSILFLLNKNHIERMQKLHNKIMRAILWVNKYTPINKLLDSLCWISVKQRILLNTLTLIFKSTKGLTPTYLCEKLGKPKNNVTLAHNTRSAHHIDVQRTLTIFGNNSIYCKGAILFNKLPQNIRDVSSPQIFRRECLKIIRDPNLWKPGATDINTFWCSP